MPYGSERRKFPRLKLNVEVTYRPIGKIETPVLSTESKNISAGGIRIILLENLDVATLLDLSFSLPDTKEIIKTKAKIAWVEGFVVGDPLTGKAYEAGVEFIGINPQAQEKINQYVSTHL